jgi:hypothetical protein
MLIRLKILNDDISVFLLLSLRGPSLDSVLVVQHGYVRAGPRGDQVYEELQHAPRAAGRQVEPAAHAPPSLGLQQVRTTTDQSHPLFPIFYSRGNYGVHGLQ